MKAWSCQTSEDFSGLSLIEVPPQKPGVGEVLLRLRAASLNFRDLMIARGEYPLPIATPVIPLADACWEVVEIGEGVSRVVPGDRAINTFVSGWLDGALEPWMWNTALGCELDGVLTQFKVLSEDLLVPVPDHLTDEEAATLPCAAVTAWNALFWRPQPLVPGQTVLALGTGGVSTFAVQLAKAAGARVIATSSSDEKLAKMASLGVDVTINYKTIPDWDEAVVEATGGKGADVVVEVGGPGTLPKSLNAVRHGGRIALVGALSDPMGTINPGHILTSHAHVHGIMAGSRKDTADLVQMIDTNRIKPYVYKSYAFDDAPQAFRDMAAGGHMGKLVISG